MKSESEAGMRRIFLLLVLLMAGRVAAAETRYVSPDGAVTVLVTAQGGSDCEAQIEFRIVGQDSLKLDYRSADHEHGECWGEAKWTPDGQFFVFSLEHAGGHQPWHTPIVFFSRRSGRVSSLEEFLPRSVAITGHEFTATPPDAIEFETIVLPWDGHEPVLRKVSLGTLKEPAR